MELPSLPSSIIAQIIHQQGYQPFHQANKHIIPKYSSFILTSNGERREDKGELLLQVFFLLSHLHAFLSSSHSLRFVFFFYFSWDRFGVECEGARNEEALR